MRPPLKEGQAALAAAVLRQPERHENLRRLRARHAMVHAFSITDRRSKSQGCRKVEQTPDAAVRGYIDVVLRAPRSRPGRSTRRSGDVAGNWRKFVEEVVDAGTHGYARRGILLRRRSIRQAQIPA